MTVTKIEPLDKKRSKVFTDEDFALVLYRGEIKRLGLSEGSELSEETLSFIKEEILYKRAKERSLFILKSGDKTEKELKDKLRDGGYPEDVIARTLCFLSEYGLCDDRRYCMNYLREALGKRSERAIRERLMRKGVPKDVISESLEAMREELAVSEEHGRIFAERKFVGKAVGTEESLYSKEAHEAFSGDDPLYYMQKKACLKALLKKLGRRAFEGDIGGSLEAMDDKEKRSVYSSLMRKGFGYELIKACIKEADEL